MSTATSLTVDTNTNPAFANLIDYVRCANPHETESTIELWRNILPAYFPLHDSYIVSSDQNRDQYGRKYKVLNVHKYKIIQHKAGQGDIRIKRLLLSVHLCDDNNDDDHVTDIRGYVGNANRTQYSHDPERLETPYFLVKAWRGWAEFYSYGYDSDILSPWLHNDKFPPPLKPSGGWCQKFFFGNEEDRPEIDRALKAICVESKKSGSEGYLVYDPPDEPYDHTEWKEW
jgi:hypothetical protein